MTDKNRNFSLEEEYFIRSAIFSILSLADMFIFFNNNNNTSLYGLHRMV